MLLRSGYLLLVGLFVLLSGCKKACDSDDAPHYPLAANLRAWSAPYPKDAVLQFRNAATGYVRRYRVVTAESQRRDVHTGVDPCPEYTQEYTSHALERTDSTNGRENQLLKFEVFAATNVTRFKSTMAVGSTSFDLPLEEIEAGTQALAPATFAGRTYPAVAGYNASPAVTRPNATVTMYLTKANGLIRFEERGGTVWDRL